MHRQLLHVLLAIPFFMLACNNDDKRRDCLPGVCGEAQECGDAGTDFDGDGYVTYDCDNTDCSINPSATEICDGQDNDCDDHADFDLDDDIKQIDGRPIVVHIYNDADRDNVCSKEVVAVCFDIVPDTEGITYYTDDPEKPYAYVKTCEWPWHPDSDFRSELYEDFSRWHSEDEVTSLMRWLQEGNEDEMLGPDAKNYWDPCDTGEEEDCFLPEYPACQYTKPSTFDEYPEYTATDEEFAEECAVGW